MMRGLLTFVLLVAIGAVAVADERILGWQSDIRVRPDSTLEVTETLRVRAEGQQIRRGLLRDFPTRYVDRRGQRVVTGFEVIAVLRDGRTEPHTLEKLANGVRIRIGDPDVHLSPQDYEYTISYRTDRQLGFFADHDELYWNVTGNGWDFPIDAVEARVYLPGSIDATDIRRRGLHRPARGAGSRLAGRGRSQPGDVPHHPWSRPTRGTHDRRELAEGSRDGTGPRPAHRLPAARRVAGRSRAWQPGIAAALLRGGVASGRA